MHITIINDCRDANAAGRQTVRDATLLGESISFIGVASDLEASGNLIDMLDAYGDSEGVILVNVAPRNGKAKKWKNGTPFGYFWYKKILVVSSVDGLTLSLIKKLRLTTHINVLDIPTVIDHFVQKNLVTPETGTYIVNTQFRSYEFLPRIAAYLMEHKDVVSEKLPIEEIADAPLGIWWVDNFGNCKTTLLRSEISSEDRIQTKFGALEYFERLKDVPDGTKALITGSSGIETNRFLELVVQGEHASKLLGTTSGDQILV